MSTLRDVAHCKETSLSTILKADKIPNRCTQTMNEYHFDIKGCRNTALHVHVGLFQIWGCSSLTALQFAAHPPAKLTEPLRAWQPTPDCTYPMLAARERRACRKTRSKASCQEFHMLETTLCNTIACMCMPHLTANLTTVSVICVSSILRHNYSARAVMIDTGTRKKWPVRLIDSSQFAL